MKTRLGITLAGACAAIGLLAGCGGDDEEGKETAAKGQGGSVLRLSSPAKKVLAVSADNQGIKGRSRLGASAGQAPQPGQPFDLSGVRRQILDRVKQQTGLDVRLDCPQSVTYTPGIVVFCKLYTPDGTGFDVKVTLNPDSFSWEIVTTQPVPAPPTGPTQKKLEDKRGKATARAASGPRTGLEPGDVLDLTGLDSQIESQLSSETGLQINVDCPTSVDYSPGATFYCKAYDPNWVAYDVLCTQDEFGTISWSLPTPIPPAQATGNRLSSDAKKVVSASAKEKGLGARSKLTAGQAPQPGQPFDLSGVRQQILADIKQQTGVDVRLDCPQSVTYTPGIVVFCKLYTPDGTAFDVQVTLNPDSFSWKIVTTQPVPPQPQGPTSSKLEGAKGKASTGRRDRQLRAAEQINTSTIDDQIEQILKQEKGLDVQVECPDAVDAVQGATFYCKLYTSDGTAYDVECRVVDPATGQISWTVIIKPRT